MIAFGGRSLLDPVCTCCHVHPAVYALVCTVQQEALRNASVPKNEVVTDPSVFSSTFGFNFVSVGVSFFDIFCLYARCLRICVVSMRPGAVCSKFFD